jgi:GNAT superfamily N-acetyltransferase
VHFLFVDGRYHGQGIGRKVFELALADYREKNPELKVMTVNSTFFAVEAYKKLGFIPIPNSYHQHNGGTFVSMQKQLTV